MRDCSIAEVSPLITPHSAIALQVCHAYASILAVTSEPKCSTEFLTLEDSSQPPRAKASAIYMSMHSSQVPSSYVSTFTDVQALSHHVRPASIVRL